MVESTTRLDQFLPEPPDEKPQGGCASCGAGKAPNKQARCGNGLENIYPTTAVRFGYMRYIGEFSHPPDMRFTCCATVVIQTKRGIEMGEQVSLTCDGCDRAVTRDQMRAWVEASGEDSFIFDAGRMLREATAADLAEYARIQSGNRSKRDLCQELAEQHDLPLRVVDCETLFGGERIVFYFMAAERVDFRAVVKELATEYRTRIEMRQIGARDEARLLADYETCGREVCCKVFLKTLRPISMRMAKLQKATLDPSQVSGRCGRLKCCLRYEHASYEELDKQLPRVGVRIRTNHGEGVVANRQVLTQLVQLRKDDDVLMTVVAEDITEVDVPAPPRPAESAGTPGPEESAVSRPGAEQGPPGGGAPPARKPARAKPPRPARTPPDAPKREKPAARGPSQPDASAGRVEGGDSSARRRRRRGRRRRRRRPGRSDPAGGDARAPSND